MIKILETITEQDYKKDILDYINKTISILNDLENSIKKDSCPIQSDTVSTKIHKIYADIITLSLDFYKD